jgi:DNA polymerase-3 subunit delta
MQWKPNNVQAAIRAADPTQWPAIIVLFGDDGGQIANYAKDLVKASGIAPDDPFNYIQISVDDLLAQPGLLLESAGTLSFGGGHRLIRLVGCGSELSTSQEGVLASAFEALADTQLDGVTVICPLPGVDAKGKVVKVVQKASQAAWLRCYLDNERSLRQVLQEFGRSANRRIAPDAQDFLLQNLGNDRNTTQHELEKLELYTEGRPDITLQDCLAVLAEAPSANVFALCDAIGQRDRAAVDRLIQQLWYEGADANFVLSMVVRHLDRIAQVQQAMSEGKTPQQALEVLKPRVMFGQDMFLRQVNRYPSARLKTLSSKALELQAQSRGGVLSPAHVVARGLLSLGA